MSNLPLLVFETNILMDVLLGRDSAAVLLVGLAEERKLDLVVPEYVLFEFRGTALRWIRGEQARLVAMRKAANEWARSQELGEPAEAIRGAAGRIEKKLAELPREIDVVLARVRAVATVKEHTPEIHFRGDVRCLQGLPPDRPAEGIRDCRIYEAILAIAQADAGTSRKKYLVTKNGDFDYPELVEELGQLGFALRKDPGRLYGELRRAPG